MEMDTRRAVSDDVAEAPDEADVIEIGSIHISSDGAAFTSSEPGVICNFHGSADSTDPVITLSLDTTKWRTIPTAAGTDVDRESVAHAPPYGHCEACGCRRQGRSSDPRFCQPCQDAQAKDASQKRAAILPDALD
jgi:hypothetical protein